MINTVLLDLDGTLLDRHSSLIVYVHQQMARCGVLLKGVPPADYLARVVQLDNRGYTAKDVVFRQIQEEFHLPEGSWEILFRDFKEFFPDICVPFPKMHQTLRSLKERGLVLGLVTNGSNASQNPKIDGLGIRPYFGAILVSEAEGVKKPDPEIFHRALRRLGSRPEDAAFVGDNPEVDIHAAKAVGMKTIWMRDPYWSAPGDADATIEHLAELPEAIDRMGAK